jgi:hypothetical protein
MNADSRSKALLLIIALSITTLGTLLFLPHIAQDPLYHNFADTRSFCGVPNFGDVTSNVLLLLSGIVGIAFMLRKSVRTPGETFLTRAEWWPYLVFFLGALLTGIGSTYYHWAPGSERLVWDRLPMTIAFMGIFSAVIAERIETRAGTYLTLPLLILGIGSVFNWAASEKLGVGDLRLYVFVQFFPLLCMPVILYSFAPRYTHNSGLAAGLGFYVLAKVFEYFDWQVLLLTGVSGHTIKHILSGLAIFAVLHFLWKRKPTNQVGEIKTA